MGTVRLEDAETGEIFEVATSSRPVREAYQKAVEERATALQREFRRQQVDSITLRTDRDWVPALQNFFKNRETRMGARI